MFTRFVRSKGVARLALLGLTLGLAALIALAWISKTSTDRTTAQIRANQAISEHWDSVLVSVSTEYELLGDFVRATSVAGREPLASAIGSADSSLAWLRAHTTGSEQERVVEIDNTYDAYTEALHRLVIAGQIGQGAKANLLAEQATLSAAAVRKQIVAASVRTRAEMRKYLEAVDKFNRRFGITAAIVGVVDFVLLVISGSVLLSYQRNIERQAVESRHASLHDNLTGIANRALLLEKADKALADAKAGVRMAALLLLDLNRFKEINDTLGHYHGDLLLCEVARRLREATRGDDTVARLGGDEFAVLLPNIAGRDAVTSATDRILFVMQHPAILDGTVVDVSTSIGAAVYPVHGETSGELMRHADIAMYAAKRGQTGAEIYDPEVHRELPADQLSVLGELREAIDRDELLLYYQPKAHADSGEIKGVEALVRWQHPRRGLLGPGDFIPLAERSDVIGPLTDHVLAAALHRQRLWREAGCAIPVAVNIAAHRLLDPTFVDLVAVLLREHEATPSQLTLEITESTVIADPPRAIAVLTALHQVGVRISIDDFGTGHSSMSYLQRMPLDELKIDRQFVSGLRSSAADLAIVRAILELAHALGLEVVAEGVEDAETWAALDAMECDAIQGYHLGRPMPADQVLGWLAKRPGARLSRPFERLSPQS